MEISFSRIQPRQFARENLSRLLYYLEEHSEYFNFHRKKGLILSFFAPFLLAVHVFLFLEAIDTFSFMTFVNMLLSLLLLLPWAVVPGLFLFYSSQNRKGIRIWGGIWAILMVGAEIAWFVYLTPFSGN